MNKINEGGQLFEVGWSIKMPLANRWVVWLKDIKIIELVEKRFDNNGYYFARIGYEGRPEEYVSQKHV